MPWDELDGWSGVTVRPFSGTPPAAMGRAAPFRASWGMTTEVLDRELRHLSATQFVLELAIGEADLRLDGKPRASARPAHPGVTISMQTRHGPLRYSTAEFSDWRDNVRAIALALEALRKVDRYGVSKRGEQYRGWRALGAGGEDDIERGRRLIHALGGVRDALKATHPDAGGDPADFRAVQAAREAGVS